jgi:thioredoxin reductase (NADPH)
MSTPDDIVDLAIIGGGPVGLFGAFYAGMRQMSVKIIDSLEQLGGQLMTLYPEKYIYDVAGFPKILAKDLATNLIEQAMQYSPQPCLGEQVLQLARHEAAGLFHLMTSQNVHHARCVLIAAGLGAFQPKALPLEGAKAYEGRGLHYFVKKLDVFAGRRVLIVGGGDSAVDWANMLSPIAASVDLIHRRDQFRAHEDSVTKMKQTKTRLHLFYELKTLAGEGRVRQAVIYDNRTKAEQTLEVDDVVASMGFINSLGPISQWGIELQDKSIKVDSEMHTNIEALFAAGDIATYPGKLKLIATGFGEACVAVNVAKHLIDPKASLFPGHSSTMKGN